EKWPQRHRDTEQKEKKAFPTISFSLFLCVSVSLWQNKCLNVACPDLDRDTPVNSGQNKIHGDNLPQLSPILRIFGAKK
ncbi:MAG TPA: hypothetical protein VI260_20225, partial [Blastocatellia bacterium]